VSLDFYSPLRGATVSYELRANAGGTWRTLLDGGYGDGDGIGESFALVSSGNVTTSSWRDDDGEADDGTGVGGSRRGELTRIPSPRGRLADPIRIDGGGARRAVYLALSTRDLLYSRGSAEDDDDDDDDATSTKTTTTTGAGEGQVEAMTSIEDPSGTDTIVLASTPELVVYAGAAVMAYHPESAVRVTDYRIPRGFVGRVWYHRDPCREMTDDDDGDGDDGGDDGDKNEEGGAATPGGGEKAPVVEWEDCEVRREEVDGEAPLPDVDDKGLIPFFVEDVVGGSSGGGGQQQQQQRPPSNDNGGGVVNASNGGATSPAPSSSIDASMRVYLVMTLSGEVSPDRTLDEGRGEVDAFANAMLGFYSRMGSLDANEVELAGCGVRYQQILLARKGEEDGRSLQRRQENDGIEGSTTPDAVVPDAPGSAVDAPTANGTTTMVAGLSLEVTLVVYVLFSPLPRQITQELMQALILDNEAAVISSLRNETALSSYFVNLDSVPSVIVVDNVTNAPTNRPSESPTPFVPTPAPTRGQPIVTAWQLGALLYASLAAFSLAYIKRARGRMETNRNGNNVFDEEFDGLVRMEEYERIASENVGETMPAKRAAGRRGSILGRSLVMFRGSFAKSRIASEENDAGEEDDGGTSRRHMRRSSKGSILGRASIVLGSNVDSRIATEDVGENDGGEMSQGSGGGRRDSSLTGPKVGSQIASEEEDDGEEAGEMLQRTNKIGRMSILLGNASNLGGSSVRKVILQLRNKANKDPVGSFVSFDEDRACNLNWGEDEEEEEAEEEEEEAEEEEEEERTSFKTRQHWGLSASPRCQEWTYRWPTCYTRQA
jgi:hypothetical protein